MFKSLGSWYTLIWSMLLGYLWYTRVSSHERTLGIWQNIALRFPCMIFFSMRILTTASISGLALRLSGGSLASGVQLQKRSFTDIEYYKCVEYSHLHFWDSQSGKWPVSFFYKQWYFISFNNGGLARRTVAWNLRRLLSRNCDSNIVITTVTPV